MSSGAAFEIELRWFLGRYNPVRDDGGQILRWYAACTDIDDRRRAEEGLKEENVALREEIDRASMFEEIVGTSSLPSFRVMRFTLCTKNPVDCPPELLRLPFKTMASTLLRSTAFNRRIGHCTRRMKKRSASLV